MRLLKWITGIAGGLILIIIITAVIILSRYDFNSLKPFISKAVHDATGRELTIEKDIDLDIGLTPSLVLSGVKFQNADWGTRKDMLNVGRFELKVSLMPLLKGSVKVHRFILRDFDVLIETDKSGNANYQFDTGEKAQAEEKEAAPGTIPAFAVNKLEIENGVITYRDGKTGNTQSLTITNLKTGIKGFEDPLTIDLNGKYNDEPFKVSGTLGSIRGLNNPEFPWPFDLSINAFGTAAGFKGSIKNPAEQSGINIDFNVRINDWSFLSKLAEAEIPIKDALSITGNLTDRSSKNYNLSSAKVMLGQNQIDASADINLSGNTPFINAQISSKGIDLSPYIKESEAPEKGEEEKERLFSSEPLDLDTLKAINGRFKVSIDKLVLPDMVLNAVSLESAINDGRLELRPLKMSMAGGNIDVKLDIASRLDGADLSAAVNVEGLELDGLLEMVGIGDEIQGLVDMEIDIKGRGNSMAGIMGSLSGYSTVSVSEGVISNKYMGLLGSDFSKGVMRMLNPSKESKDYTAVRCMV
ncbi:MAG: AsmA family protein, partial [Deltaproteobacteria bacterium]|nr:AsmA family protein [Deltaproteobacteria bacterium]